MAKNKITDLNNHLFAQLERLSDDDMTDDKIEMEIKRSKAMASISNEIIKGSSLIFKTAIAISKGDIDGKKLPDLLSDGVSN